MAARKPASSRSGAASSWNDLLFDAIPLAPVWICSGLALALLLGLLLVAWLSGGLDRLLANGEDLWNARDARVTIWLSLMAAYLPAARRYTALQARESFEGLRPLVSPTKRRAAAARTPFGSLDRRELRLAGLIGLLIVPLSALGVDRDPLLYFREGYWRAETVWTFTVGPIAAWHVGCFVYATVAYARGLSELAETIPQIDLLDLRPLAPFARLGLRSALLWLIVIALSAVHFVDPDFLWVGGALDLLGIAAATAALLLPVRGARRRISAEKEAEIERIDSAIRGEPRALSESLIARRREAAGLADLLAYRSFVQSVREWPFDAPTIARFLLYLVIPLGSWLGGATVERLLAVALD